MSRLFLAFLALMFCATPAFADDQSTTVPMISADRPGTGSDPAVVPLYTLNAEMGTDSREIRFGFAPKFELDRDDTTWGIKYGFLDTDANKGAIKVAIDSNHQVDVEIPLQHTFNKLFYVGTDVILSKSSQTYVGEFNITPTDRLTFTNDVYYDGKVHYGIYASWIPPHHNDVQFDIGYSEKKVALGISIAVDFHRHH